MIVVDRERPDLKAPWPGTRPPGSWGFLFKRPARFLEQAVLRG